MFSLFGMRPCFVAPEVFESCSKPPPFDRRLTARFNILIEVFDHPPKPARRKHGMGLILPAAC